MGLPPSFSLSLSFRHILPSGYRFLLLHFLFADLRDGCFIQPGTQHQQAFYFPFQKRKEITCLSSFSNNLLLFLSQSYLHLPIFIFLTTILISTNLQSVAPYSSTFISCCHLSSAPNHKIRFTSTSIVSHSSSIPESMAVGNYGGYY